ncbi:hypothetical protein L3X38_004145 [Prunus dulcis]|uniref:Uncharacterized protein n=1 Tax=Prunus dulcis TaxID=3755 RepID=A0AAD4ZNF0_PRUDU|nr:hypothetical protein L3X38_004145 [Prunus dulcis]
MATTNSCLVIGKAKGKDGNGTPIVIHRGRIITTRAVRTIGVLFYQAIDGAWPTFKTFPSTQMDLLYDRFNTTGYTHTCSEEEMREAFEQHDKIKRNKSNKVKSTIVHTTGGGYSTKDVYPSDDQACNKCICLEREEEHEKLKEEVKDLKSVLYELKDLVQSMRENNSNTYARSRQSASMDNVESCLDAHLEDE